MRSEFELIELFTSRLPHPPAPMGPGDDCAVLPATRGQLCLTTDALMEGVHFSRPAFSLEDVGHKALAVNLSDLAAMGAKPAWFLCALALPHSFSERDVLALAKGMQPLARKHRVQLIGGNITSAKKLSLTLTLGGYTPAPLLRSTAHALDAIYVSGTLGDAACGLAHIDGKRLSAALRYCVQAQRRPNPCVELGLLARKFASAAIDISDGLLQDLAHLLKASRVGAELGAAYLPLSTALRQMPRPRALKYALHGGEDYQLLLTVPARKRRAFEVACRRAGHPVTHIGDVTKKRALLLDGKPVAAKGFIHF
ncbi:MAG: thiamine-phosphate kinase [Myxococcaceae bacterium]|nr:thiamine-phosphate kinase [Myxococcaceae bacterium]